MPVEMATTSKVTIVKLSLKDNFAVYFIKPEFDEKKPMEKTLSRLRKFIPEFPNLIKDQKAFQIRIPSEIGIPMLYFEEETDLLQELEDPDLRKQISICNGLISCEESKDLLIAQDMKFSSISKIEMNELKDLDSIVVYYDPDLKCDSPFIINCPTAFAIVHEKTKTIISMGQFLKFN